MRKKFVIFGFILLLAGASALGWLLIQERKEQEKVASYKLKYSTEIDDYLKQYNDWLKLSPEERTSLPLVLDEHGKTKQEQQERLQAHLDDLAAGEVAVDPFADILYGENWQEELSKYKKRKELNELAFSGSILCTLIGGTIFSFSLLLMMARFLIRGSSYIAQFASNCVRGQKSTKAKQPAKADAKPKANMKAKGKAKGKVSDEIEAKSKTKAKGKDKAQAEELTKAEEKAKAKAEAKEKKRAEAEAQARDKAERKAKAKAEKLARAEEKAKAKAEAKEKKRAAAEAEAKAKAERKAKAKAEKLARAEEKAKAKAEAKEKAVVEIEAIEDEITLEQQEKKQEPRDQVKKHSEVLKHSGWKSLEAKSTSRGSQAPSQTLSSMKSGFSFKNSAKNAEELAKLLSDEKSIEQLESLQGVAENVNISSKLEDSLKAKTENFENQMAEFRQTAHSVQQSTLEHSEPINSTLNELTQQISAIREYAASQQDRLEKLQDGYDWNIIRTFCLRVIHCIDNLENRISQLSKKDAKATHLEEIRDELVFALESSGIEQFEPEINSDYRGQEKYAEAIKDKQRCNNPKQTGKIAVVIRPGYQYFINEENIKVVRPAQVKLYA